MNWKVWAQGLAAAALGGAASGTAQYTQASGGKVSTGTLICAGIGALFTGVAYILKSPLTAQPAPTVVAPPTTDAPVAQPPVPGQK